MAATTYENRFRDPEFVAIWERWQEARDAWRKLTDGGGAPGWFTQEHDLYDPDPSRLPEGPKRAVAREYLDARVAYNAKVAEYNLEEES